MRKDLGAKPILYPQPVLIIAAYGNDGNADAMNAAWGGITDYKEITMSLSASHKTVKNILETKAFTVSMGEAKYVKECDYLGMVSGNKEPDKLKKAGFSVVKSDKVNAPIINELSLTLECELIDYEDEIMRGKIVNVSVDESILTDDHIDLSKLQPITFDAANNAYVVLGNQVGNAFKDGLEIK